MKTIARIYNDLNEKFGVPRQSGLAEHVLSRIVFEPEYRDLHAFRGLEAYSHIWLIWQFSEHVDREWSPTVRPPRLGGNTRVGVFATRSPFRPNPVGLSCVKLVSVELETEDGPVLYVSGADLMNDTPIYDIKPYLPYVDCYPEAKGSFAEEKKNYRLKVEISDEIREEMEKVFAKDLLKRHSENNDRKRVVIKSNLPIIEKNKAITENSKAGIEIAKPTIEGYKLETDIKINGLIELLALDPRPSYQNDPERVYGMAYCGRNVKFRVEGDVLTVVEIL